MMRKAGLLGICILLAGCSINLPGFQAATPSAVGNLPPDLYHFASDQCQAPCWQGITPGISDSATADKIVNGFIHSSASGRDMRFFNGYNQVGYSVDLVYRAEKVRTIRIFLSANKPRLEEVIDLLGRPDRVVLFDSEMPDSAPTYETDILYMKRGIWLSSSAEFSEANRKGQLNPNLDINEITFFSPGDKFGSLEGDRSTKILQYVGKWKGYSGYDIQFLFFEQLR